MSPFRVCASPLADWYYAYATVGMLLGDGGAAKSRATQMCSIVIMLSGNVMLAIVFSKIILAIQAQSAARDAYSNKMRAINDAMSSQGVPSRLQRRVRRFFEFKYMLMAGLDDPATSYISELPNALRVDIMDGLYAQHASPRMPPRMPPRTRLLAVSRM